MSFFPSAEPGSARLVVGRVLLASLFLVSGLLKIPHFAGVAGRLADMGLPLATWMAAGAIVVEVGGGLALALGWRVRDVARLLALFIVPATLMFHAFWSVGSPAEFGNQLNHFLKNLALIGALWIVAGHAARDAG